MTHLDVAAIGERIKRYRRLNQDSAADLAERAGGGLTQEILTKIENGKRQDIGIRQLWAIADALGVPLIALLLPLNRPYDLADGSHAVADALAGQLGWTAKSTLPAAREAHAQLAALRAYEALRHNWVDTLKHEPGRSDDVGLQARRDAMLALRDHEAVMRAVGIDTDSDG